MQTVSNERDFSLKRQKRKRKKRRDVQSTEYSLMSKSCYWIKIRCGYRVPPAANTIDQFERKYRSLNNSWRTETGDDSRSKKKEKIKREKRKNRLPSLALICTLFSRRWNDERKERARGTDVGGGKSKLPARSRVSLLAEQRGVDPVTNIGDQRGNQLPGRPVS